MKLRHYKTIFESAKCVVKKIRWNLTSKFQRQLSLNDQSSGYWSKKLFKTGFLFHLLPWISRDPHDIGNWQLYIWGFGVPVQFKSSSLIVFISLIYRLFITLLIKLHIFLQIVIIKLEDWMWNAASNINYRSVVSDAQSGCE